MSYRKALELLEWAAQAAEGTGPISPPAVVEAVDFRLAASIRLQDLRARLDRVMMASDAERGLDALLACGALGALLPPVKDMVGFSDDEWRHKDVWKHTKQVVRQAAPKLEIRWAALLHDIGKVKTRTISPSGEVHFLGHAEVGARMFESMERRTPLFKDEPSLRESIHFLILHHLRAHQYEDSWTDSAVRRLAKEIGASLDDLICLSKADITTKRPNKRNRGLANLDKLAARVAELAEADAVLPLLPPNVGNAVMDQFGLPPSRQIGEIRRELERAIEAGQVAPRAPVETYLAFIAADRARFGLS